MICERVFCAMTDLAFSPAAYLCALLSTLLVIGVPCVLGLLVSRRHKGAGHAIVIGIFCFVIGAYLLEQIFHTLVFGVFGQALQANPLLYAVYGGLTAGVFEESARVFGLRSLCRKDAAPAIGFGYGIGHGGFEAILLTGMGLVNNLVIMTTVAFGGPDNLLAGYEGDDLTRARQQLAEMAALPATSWLAAGIERCAALAVQIALSMLIWMVVTRRLPRWGWALAVLLHAIVNLPAGFYQAGLLPMWPAEGLIVLLAAAVAVLVFLIYRRRARQG